MSSTAVSEVDLRRRIVDTVRHAKGPLTFNALAKSLRVKPDLLREPLHAAAEAGEVFRWPKYCGSESYWHLRSEDQAKEAILAVAAEQALSKSALCRAAAKKVRGFSERSIQPHVRPLLEEKKLSLAPAFSGSGKLYMKAGEQEAYFRSLRELVHARIRGAGFDAAAFFAPKPDENEAGALILEAVILLEPVRGVPVPTLRLRNHLRNLSKQEFDGGALELRRRQQVFLSQHADPYNISEEDKELLIDGQDGTYYVAIALR